MKNTIFHNHFIENVPCSWPLLQPNTLNPFFFTTMQKSKGMHDQLFIKMEKLFSSTFLRHAYIKFFERATIEEFQMADIQKNDAVLHIGCGPLPNTLISLARHSDATYVGIDRDPESVAIAQKMVDEYHLKNVTIEHGDALHYPLGIFDFIIISFGVEPKEEIFERMRCEMRDDARIIYRKQWDFMDAIYGRRDFIPQGFEVVDVHHRRDMLKSYLLKRIQ